MPNKRRRQSQPNLSVLDAEDDRAEDYLMTGFVAEAEAEAAATGVEPSVFFEMVNLLEKGSYEEFKDLYDRVGKDIIETSMFRSELKNRLNDALSDYKTKTSSTASLSREVINEIAEIEIDSQPEIDSQRERDNKTKTSSTASSSGEANHEIAEIEVDSQRERECMSLVAKLVAEQLKILLEPPVDVEDSSEGIRKRDMGNAVTRWNRRPCRVDYAWRRASQSAVKRDVISTGLKRVKWSEAEELALVQGLEKHKGFHWATILSDPEFAVALRLRRNVDLKDKYRILRKGSKYDFSALDEFMSKIC
jgi:hypothetical protein